MWKWKAATKLWKWPSRQFGKYCIRFVICYGLFHLYIYLKEGKNQKVGTLYHLLTFRARHPDHAKEGTYIYHLCKSIFGCPNWNAKLKTIPLLQEYSVVKLANKLKLCLFSQLRTSRYVCEIVIRTFLPRGDVPCVKFELHAIGLYYLYLFILTNVQITMIFELQNSNRS